MFGLRDIGNRLVFLCAFRVVISIGIARVSGDVVMGCYVINIVILCTVIFCSVVFGNCF